MTWIQAQPWGSQARGSSRVSSTYTAAWENVTIFLCSASFFFSFALLSAVRALFPLAREHVALSSEGFRACHWQEAEQAFPPCFENGLLLVDRACKSFLMCWRKCYFFFVVANMTPIQNYFSCFSIFAKGTKEPTMTLKFTPFFGAGQQWRPGIIPQTLLSVVEWG